MLNFRLPGNVSDTRNGTSYERPSMPMDGWNSRRDCCLGPGNGQMGPIWIWFSIQQNLQNRSVYLQFVRDPRCLPNLVCSINTRHRVTEVIRWYRHEELNPEPGNYQIVARTNNYEVNHLTKVENNSPSEAVLGLFCWKTRKKWRANFPQEAKTIWTPHCT